MGKRLRVCLTLFLIFLLSLESVMVSLAGDQKKGGGGKSQIHVHVESGLKYISSVKLEYDTNGNGVFDDRDELIEMTRKGKNSPEFSAPDGKEYAGGRILFIRVYHISSGEYYDRFKSGDARVGSEGGGTINYRVRVSPRASISIQKTADKSLVQVGDTIVYTIVVMNDGDVALTGVTVTDDRVPNLANANIKNLAVGAVVTLSGSYKVVTGDGNSVVNTVSAAGSYKHKKVAGSDSTAISVVHPSLKIEKTADRTEAKVGDTIIYTITVKNTGDVNLTGVTVTDDLIDLNPDAARGLRKGESFTLTGGYAVPEEKSGEEVINNASAVGYCGNHRVDGSASYTVAVNRPIPEKPAPGGPTDLPKTGEVPPGVFCGLGAGLASLGIYLKRRK